MALHDGSWRFRLEHDGKVLENSTDELPLAMFDVAERASGIPWALWDPRRSARVAMGLFVVLMVQDGMPEEQALALVPTLPGKVLTGAFEWVPPEKPLQPATGDEKGAGDTDPPA